MVGLTLRVMAILGLAILTMTTALVSQTTGAVVLPGVAWRWFGQVQDCQAV